MIKKIPANFIIFHRSFFLIFTITKKKQTLKTTNSVLPTPKIEWVRYKMPNVMNNNLITGETSSRSAYRMAGKKKIGKIILSELCVALTANSPNTFKSPVKNRETISAFFMQKKIIRKNTKIRHRCRVLMMVYAEKKYMHKYNTCWKS